MAPADKGKKVVALIGYGSQGRAIALNLRDSGFKVQIGLRPRSRSRRLAKTDGFDQIQKIEGAVTNADIICFAFPDHHHGTTFEQAIAPNMRPGTTLLFLHALSVHFGMVRLPDNSDVVLIAPHAPGPAVREKFLDDRTISAFVAVEQDQSGNARQTATHFAGGIGIQSKRLVDTTFRDEAIGDIFGEQAVLCGGLAMLVKCGFEVLLEKGHKSDHAYLEVAYQLELIANLIRKHGINGMFDRISMAARFGSARNGPKIINRSVKDRMFKLYDTIEGGDFARNFGQLDQEQIQKLQADLAELSHPEFEKAARKFSR